MSQQNASPAWSQSPRARKSAADTDAVDKFVRGGKPGAKEELVRLNIEIPKTLRTRVKAGCALEEVNIKDVILEFLEKRFPKQTKLGS
jgi:hypothetical protein